MSDYNITDLLSPAFLERMQKYARITNTKIL